MKSIVNFFKDPCQRAIGVSVLISFIMLVGKGLAYWMTDSTAILSDAMESVVHLLVTSLTALSVWYSRLPADEDHPYGHGKIVYFAGAAEAGVLLCTALWIIGISVDALAGGHGVSELETGLTILTILAVVNLALGRYLIYVGKKHGSVALVANGQHVLADMWTSLGIVLGVGVVAFTDLFWLDPLIAIAVSFHILNTSLKLMKRAYEGLMERVDPSTTDLLVSCLDSAQDEGLIRGHHQLRHRSVDRRLWVDVHLTFEEHLTLQTVHARACAVEMSVRSAFPKLAVWITTHLEPEGHEENHPVGHFEQSEESFF